MARQRRFGPRGACRFRRLAEATSERPHSIACSRDVGGPTRPILLAIRNNFRRRARLALTVLTLAAGGLFFMTALNLRASMINTLDRLFASKQYDLGVTLNGTHRFADADRLIREFRASFAPKDGSPPRRGCPARRRRGRTPRLIPAAAVFMVAAVGGRSVPDVALPVPSTVVRQEIVQGRGLMPGDTDTLVINTALAAKVARVRRRAASDAADGAERGLAPDCRDLARAVHAAARLHAAGVLRSARGPSWNRQHDSGGARTRRCVSIEKAKADLERVLVAGGMQPLSISSKADSRFGFDQHMLMIYVFLVVMAFMLAAVGGLGLATTMSISVLERRRELGILRAIGATPRMVGSCSSPRGPRSA